MTPNEILLILKFLAAVMPPADAQADATSRPAWHTRLLRYRR
jgi:hypothetical protein